MNINYHSIIKVNICMGRGGGLAGGSKEEQGYCEEI